MFRTILTAKNMIFVAIVTVSILSALSVVIFCAGFFSQYTNIILFSEKDKTKQVQTSKELRASRNETEANQNRALARNVFLGIQHMYPQLNMTIEGQDDFQDLEMVIPEQPGLSFRIRLSLQGDELHICAGDHYWNQWFPCTDPDVAKSYQDSLCGLIDGKYRVVDVYKRKTWVSSYLELLDESDWTRRYGCVDLFPYLCMFPLPKEKVLLQNNKE